MQTVKTNTCAIFWEMLMEEVTCVRLEEVYRQSHYIPIVQTECGPGTVLLTPHPCILLSPPVALKDHLWVIDYRLLWILQEITKRASTITLERTEKASSQRVAFDFLSAGDRQEGAWGIRRWKGRPACLPSTGSPGRCHHLHPTKVLDISSPRSWLTGENE